MVLGGFSILSRRKVGYSHPVPLTHTRITMTRTAVITEVPATRPTLITRIGMALVLAMSVKYNIMGGYAQDPKPDKTKDQESDFVALNPYIVNDEAETGERQTTLGNRTVKPILSIPSAISIADRQMMDDVGANFVHQAVQFVSAGITRTQSTSDDSQIRGFRARQTLRDGVIYRTERPMPMFDVERIEVIKGPAGMVLGANDYLGGVINAVTKMPTTKFMSDASLTYGTGNNLTFSANASGPLLKTDAVTALYRVTVGGVTGNGKLPDKDIESADQQFIGAGATFLYFKGRLRLDLNAHYSKDDGYHYLTDFLDIAGLTNYVPGSGNEATSYARLNKYSTPSFQPGLKSQSFMQSSVRFAHAVLTATLTENSNIRLAYTGGEGREHWREMRGISMNADNVTLNRQDLLLDIKAPNHLLEGEYLYRTTAQHFSNDLQIGANASWVTAYQGVRVDIPPPLNTANPDYTYNQASYGYQTTDFTSGVNNAKTTTGTYFIQDNLSFLDDRVVLVGGIRFYDSYTSTENLLTKVITPTDPPRVKLHRYGAIVKPLKGLSLYYVDASNVISNLGLNTNAQPFLDSDGTQEEWGAKFEYSGQGFSVWGNIAYFDMALTNVRTTLVDSSNPQGFVFIQTKSNTTKGWETEIGGRWKGRGGYLDAIFTSSDIKTNNALDGGQTIGVPDHMYSVFLKYTRTEDLLKGFSIGGGIHTESVKRLGTYLYKMPNLVNIFASYRYNDHWSFQLNGDNITNKYYISTIATSGLVLMSERAQYRLTAAYQW